MQNITSTVGLKNAIQLLEAEQVFKGRELNEQFHSIYESIKPVNIIRNTFKNIASEPSLIEGIVNTTIGLASGYISKKIVVGSSDNIFRKLFGSILQFGVTSVVAKNPEAVKSIGHFIFNLFVHNKEKNTESQ